MVPFQLVKDISDPIYWDPTTGRCRAAGAPEPCSNQFLLVYSGTKGGVRPTNGRTHLQQGVVELQAKAVSCTVTDEIDDQMETGIQRNRQ